MSTPPEPAAAPAPPRWAAALVLALVAVGWLGVVRAGFVWDDVPLVVRNELTSSLANVPRFFTVDLWEAAQGQEGGSGYYRPLMLLSLAVDRALYGLWAPGHHLHSLAWHLLAVFALMRLARPALGPWGALVAGLVFGLHPIQTEAVVWVAARNDAMAAALGLLALERVAWAAPERGRVLAAVGLTVLAGLAKESVVLLPAMLLVLDLGAGRRPAAWRYLPLLLGIGAVVVLRLLVGVDAAGLPQALGWSLVLQQAPQVVGLTATRLLLPWPLHNGVALEWLDRLPTWRWAVGLVALPAALGAAVVAARRGQRQALAGAALAALVLVPTLVPIADKGLLGERYLYLSVAGLGWALGAGAGRRRLAGMALVAAPALVLIQLRLPEWENDETLWTASLSRLDTPWLHSAVGHVHRGQGENVLALQDFVRGLDDPRPDASACPHVVQTATTLGQAGLVAQIGHWAARKGCRDATFLARYGTAMALVGDWDAAAAIAARAPAEGGGDPLLVLRAALARHAGTPAPAVPDRLEPAVARLLEAGADTMPPAEDAWP